MNLLRKSSTTTLTGDLRQYTIIHELGHAWVALSLGYDVEVELGVDQNDHSSGRIRTTPQMQPQHHLTVLAAGFCAERVAGVSFMEAHDGARHDVEIIYDCVGQEVGIKLLNLVYEIFRQDKDEFLDFVGQYGGVLDKGGLLVLEAVDFENY